MRLINAENADYQLEKYQELNKHENRQYSNGIRDARKIIDEQPTVDAIPVLNMMQAVKCNVCRFRRTAMCPMHMSGRIADDNDYCSKGEFE